jgi:hypothetical protein
VGETTNDPFNATLVPFKSALTAFAVVHVSVELPPAAIVVGFALMPAAGVCARAEAQNTHIENSRLRDANILELLRHLATRFRRGSAGMDRIDVRFTRVHMVGSPSRCSLVQEPSSTFGGIWVGFAGPGETSWHDLRTSGSGNCHPARRAADERLIWKLLAAPARCDLWYGVHISPVHISRRAGNWVVAELHGQLIGGLIHFDR